MINITSIESDDHEAHEGETDFTVPAFLRTEETSTALPVEQTAKKEKAEKKPKAEKPAKKTATKDVKKAAPKPTKTDDMVAMLKRAKGATGAEISEALGWLAHTTRAAVSTLPKKKQMPEGYSLTSEKDEKRGRVYRLVKQAAE